MDKKKNPHEYHRERLRERYEKEGLSSFNDHQVIELLLFYSYPRGDTNELAHDILDHFDNSFLRVFDASPEELREVKGVGKISSVFLALISDVARRYNMERAKAYSADENADPLDKIREQAIAYYSNYTSEVVAMFCLNNRFEVISSHEIFRGSVNSAHVNVRTIIEIAFAKKAASVIITHNHPSGRSLPSSEDIDTTKQLWAILNSVDLELTEHYVVAGDNCHPIMEDIKKWHTI